MTGFPALELRDAITVVSGIVTLAGVIWALRMSVTKLELNQTEMLRQLAALHKRMDRYAERLTRAEQDHAVLVERVENLRESQRFKLRARTEAVAAGETPMFREDEEG